MNVQVNKKVEKSTASEKVKKICNAEENTDIIEYCCDSAEEIIKNYCGIKEIPDGLESVFIEIACDIYRSGEYGNEAQTGRLKSLTEGDVSMSFEESSEKSGDIRKYENRLKPFRRIKWN